MCAACTDSAVTSRDACTGRLVRMCAACTDSAVTGRDVFPCRHVRICVCLSAFVCCVSLRGAWLSLYKLYVSPKSTSTARMPPRPNVYGSVPRWWCTLRNWLPAPWDAICTERTPAPSIIGNYDTRVLGTTITALALHLLMCVNTTPTKGGCGKQQPKQAVTEYIYPGCVVCMKT